MVAVNMLFRTAMLRALVAQRPGDHSTSVAGAGRICFGYAPRTGARSRSGRLAVEQAREGYTKTDAEAWRRY